MFSKVYIALTSLIAGVKVRELFSKKDIDNKLLLAISKLQSIKSARNKPTSK